MQHSNPLAHSPGTVTDWTSTETITWGHEHPVGSPSTHSPHIQHGYEQDVSGYNPSCMSANLGKSEFTSSHRELKPTGYTPFRLVSDAIKVVGSDCN